MWTTAQTAVPPHPTASTRRAGAERATNGDAYAARKKFVIDVIRSAVALPQTDPQDRLRVLIAAARLAQSVSPPLARELGQEGEQVESQLITSGQLPSVSVLESGLVDCKTAVTFIDALPVEAIGRAEAGLSGIASSCGKQSLPVLERKLEDALRRGAIAPRAMLAVMEASGLKSVWSQQQFSALFSSLPDAQRSAADAPMLAAIYERLASAVDRDTAAHAGVNFLEWLGKMDAGPERMQAVTVATEAMKKALGEERYNEALRSNVMAAQVAQAAGQPFEISPPHAERTVAVMKPAGSDQERSDTLQQLGPGQRARQAAAYGFAASQSGDATSAEHYFDLAFSAAGELWDNRIPGQDAAGVLEEVSGAAAQVDPVAALGRAEKLQDPAAQAISMLAVAQVVFSRQERAPAQMATASAPR